MSRWSTWVLMWRTPKQEIWSKPQPLHKHNIFIASICTIYFISKRSPVLGFNCTTFTIRRGFSPCCFFVCFFLFKAGYRFSARYRQHFSDWEPGLDRWLASSVPSHPSARLLTAEWHSVTPVHPGELIAFTRFRHLIKNAADGLRRESGRIIKDKRRCDHSVRLVWKRDRKTKEGERKEVG